MTKIIVDSNILFSAILNINSRIAQIIINGSKYFHFFAPEYIRYEILNHKNKIKDIAYLTENEFLETYELILRNVTVVNHSIVPHRFYKKAYDICVSIDVDDTVFIAFFNYIRGKLWTGDKKFITGLKNSGFKRLITTNELFEILIKKESNK